MKPTSYVIALGSNRRHGRYGAPARVVAAAVAALGEIGEVTAVARIRTTPALGPAGRSFANSAVIFHCALAPPALLARLKQLERAFGRRRGRRWGPRVLDLDIILWSGRCYRERGLIIPHPAFPRRAFVLQPLAEIAGHWTVAPGPRRVRQLAAAALRPRPRR